MTKENAKVAYNLAIERGDKTTSDNILIRHPDFAEKPKKETKPTKSKKIENGTKK